MLCSLSQGVIILPWTVECCAAMARFPCCALVPQFQSHHGCRSIMTWVWHHGIMASWHGSGITASWHGSGFMLSCCSAPCMAMCPAHGSTDPGPTHTACPISSFWSALCRPTPPLHLPGAPLHHCPMLQELKNCNGCRDMYKSHAQICFCSWYILSPLLAACLDLQDG